MRFSLIILSCLAFYGMMHAQNATIDSLEKVANTVKNDSILSLTYIELASNYYGYDNAKGKEALDKAWSILHKQKWDYNTGYYYNAKSDIVFYQGQYDLSLAIADSAIHFYTKAKQQSDANTRRQAEFLLAEMWASKGVTYATMNKRDTAIIYYLKGLELLEKADHPEKASKIGTCLMNIGTLYFGMGQNEKALEYNIKAIPYQLESGDDEMISYTMVFVGSSYTQLNKFDSAKYYLDKATPFVQRLNKPSVNIEYYGKIGLLHTALKEWPQAVNNYHKAYSNAVTVNDNYNQSFYLRLTAEAYYGEGQFNKAQEAALKSLAIVQANKFEGEALRLYYPLSQIYAAQKDFANAHKYLNLWADLVRAKNQADVKKKINELETKYQAEKKEAAIIQLQKDKKIQSLYIYMLIGSVIVMLIVGFLIYRNLRNRRQLVVVDAMLKGQEEERSRLAKDLHDGLGGLLSGVKFSLSNMKDNMIMTPDNMVVFERSLDMIDTSIKELRRVAHNMMPEMLLKYGLDEALREYCNSVNATKLITVRYQSFGMDKRLDNATEIIVYRVVQELLNNILKHASATEALVQLVKEDKRLSVLVEDNGKGFDPAWLDQHTGAGWTSIRSRVEYLKGHLELSSDAGKGTSVNIELTV